MSHHGRVVQILDIDPVPATGLIGVIVDWRSARRLDQRPLFGHGSAISSRHGSLRLRGLIPWLVRLTTSRPADKREPDPYQVFVIGPDGLAIAVHSFTADHDGEAAERAMRLESGLRIELWCGSRKVEDISPKPGKT
jgi:hypothetical protein